MLKFSCSVSQNLKYPKGYTIQSNVVLSGIECEVVVSHGPLATDNCPTDWQPRYIPHTDRYTLLEILMNITNFNLWTNYLADTDWSSQ